MGLHIYTVHVNTSLPEPYEQAQFVEEGFNWKAFIFTALWAFYNRLWLAGFVILAINSAIFTLSASDSGIVGLSLVEFAWHLLIGFWANDILRAKLRNRGFVTADIVTGDSLLRAEQRFFDRYFSSRNVPAVVS